MLHNPQVQHVFLQGPSANRRVRAIILPKHELSRIQSHSQWLAGQARERLQRQAQVEHMKTASQDLVKNWQNTVLNKQRERLEKRQKRIQDEEDRKNSIFLASQQQAAKERKERIEDARRMILFERDDIHQVNSAFVFSEVLHERSKQIEFNNYLKEVDEKAKRARADQVKRDIETYHEDEQKKKEVEHKAKMERKAENIKIMKEKAEREALLLAGEKEYEKQDLEDMGKEIKQVQENIENEIRRKKEHVRKDAIESIEMNKEKIKKEKQENEDEEKVIQIYRRVKQRMECLRLKQEEEARKAKHEHQERIRAIIAESLKEKEDDIEGMIAKALKEKDEKEAEILQKRKQYEAKLVKERQEYKTETEEQKKREEKDRKELRQWVLMQRLRAEEMDKVHIIKKKEAEWSVKMAVREGYNKQMENQRDIQKREEEEDLQRHQTLMKQIEREDGDFFEYAQEVMNECKTAHRPVYPIQRIIHEYRKKHGIINREKYEKWAKEMAEQEQYEKEEEEYYGQVGTMDESSLVCTSIPPLPPLLKKCSC